MVKAYLRILKYVAFMCFCGSIALFIGPAHGGRIKIMIGIVVGAAILGKRLPKAIVEFIKSVYQFFDKLL